MTTSEGVWSSWGKKLSDYFSGKKENVDALKPENRRKAAEQGVKLAAQLEAAAIQKRLWIEQQAEAASSQKMVFWPKQVIQDFYVVGLPPDTEISQIVLDLRGRKPKEENRPNSPRRNNTGQQQSIIHAQGSTVNGSMINMQGSMIGAQGSMIGAQGSMIGIQGSMVSMQGSMVGVQGSMVALQGSTFGPVPPFAHNQQGSMIAPNNGHDYNMHTRGGSAFLNQAPFASNVQQSMPPMQAPWYNGNPSSHQIPSTSTSYSQLGYPGSSLQDGYMTTSIGPSGMVSSANQDRPSSGYSYLQFTGTPDCMSPLSAYNATSPEPHAYSGTHTAIKTKEINSHDKPPSPSYPASVLFRVSAQQHQEQAGPLLTDEQIAQLCFPAQVVPHRLKRTRSWSELHSVIMHKPLVTLGNTYIFMVKLPGRLPLYGVCYAVDELIHRPPCLAQSAWPNCAGPYRQCLITAPRCYCITSHYPFFDLLCKSLNVILGLERLSRSMIYAAEITGNPERPIPMQSPSPHSFYNPQMATSFQQLASTPYPPAAQQHHSMIALPNVHAATSGSQVCVKRPATVHYIDTQVSDGSTRQKSCILTRSSSGRSAIRSASSMTNSHTGNTAYARRAVTLDVLDVSLRAATSVNAHTGGQQAPNDRWSPAFPPADVASGGSLTFQHQASQQGLLHSMIATPHKAPSRARSTALPGSPLRRQSDASSIMSAGPAGISTAINLLRAGDGGRSPAQSVHSECSGGFGTHGFRPATAAPHRSVARSEGGSRLAYTDSSFLPGSRLRTKRSKSEGGDVSDAAGVNVSSPVKAAGRDGNSGQRSGKSFTARLFGGNDLIRRLSSSLRGGGNKADNDTNKPAGGPRRQSLGDASSVGTYDEAVDAAGGTLSAPHSPTKHAAADVYGSKQALLSDMCSRQSQSVPHSPRSPVAMVMQSPFLPDNNKLSQPANPGNAADMATPITIGYANGHMVAQAQQGSGGPDATPVHHYYHHLTGHQQALPSGHAQSDMSSDYMLSKGDVPSGAVGMDNPSQPLVMRCESVDSGALPVLSGEAVGNAHVREAPKALPLRVQQVRQDSDVVSRLPAIADVSDSSGNTSSSGAADLDSGNYQTDRAAGDASGSCGGAGLMHRRKISLASINVGNVQGTAMPIRPAHVLDPNASLMASQPITSLHDSESSQSQNACHGSPVKPIKTAIPASLQCHVSGLNMSLEQGSNSLPAPGTPDAATNLNRRPVMLLHDSSMGSRIQSPEKLALDQSEEALQSDACGGNASETGNATEAAVFEDKVPDSPRSMRFSEKYRVVEASTCAAIGPQSDEDADERNKQVQQHVQAPDATAAAVSQEDSTVGTTAWGNNQGTVFQQPQAQAQLSTSQQQVSTSYQSQLQQFEPLAVIQALLEAEVPHPGDGLEVEMPNNLPPLVYFRPTLPRQYPVVGPISHLAAYAEEELVEELVPWATARLARALSPEALVTLINAALLEQSIVFFHPDAALLSTCVLGLLPLLRPFAWHHHTAPLIPVTDPLLLDSPMPFLAGCQFKTPDVRAKSAPHVRVNLYKGSVSNAANLPTMPGFKRLQALLAPHHAKIRGGSGTPATGSFIGGSAANHVDTLQGLDGPVYLTDEQMNAAKALVNELFMFLAGVPLEAVVSFFASDSNGDDMNDDDTDTGTTTTATQVYRSQSSHTVASSVATLGDGYAGRIAGVASSNLGSQGSTPMKRDDHNNSNNSNNNNSIISTASLEQRGSVGYTSSNLNGNAAGNSSGNTTSYHTGTSLAVTTGSSYQTVAERLTASRDHGTVDPAAHPQQVSVSAASNVIDEVKQTKEVVVGHNSSVLSAAVGHAPGSSLMTTPRVDSAGTLGRSSGGGRGISRAAATAAAKTNKKSRAGMQVDLRDPSTWKGVVGELRPYMAVHVGADGQRTATLLKDVLIEQQTKQDRPWMKAFLNTQMFEAYSDRAMAASCESRRW